MLGLSKFGSYDGEEQAFLAGHAYIVFSVAYSPATGELLSCSEDHTVRVWNNLECTQVLLHPTGIWSVAALDNGDIVSGCQDGVVRVWTRDPTRQASPQVIAEYEARTKAAIEQAKQGTSGKKKIGNKGEYLTPPPRFKLCTLNLHFTIPAEYDYVFTVDLEDGLPPRQLGFNLGDVRVLPASAVGCSY